MLAFYNFFLKIKLNCDIVKLVNFEIHAVFKKRCCLTKHSDLLTDKIRYWRWFWKFCKTWRNIFMTEFTVTEVTVFRVTNFWTKCSTNYNFLWRCDILNTVQIWTAKCDVNIKFWLFKFRDDNYSFFTSYDIVVYEIVRSQVNKLAVFF